MMKKKLTLQKQKIFMENEFKDNRGKNKGREINNCKINDRRNKNSFMTPQKVFTHSIKVNENSSQDKSGTFIRNNINYSRDSKEKSPYKKISNNEMEHCTTANKSNKANNNGSGSSSDKIRLNLKNNFLDSKVEKCGNTKSVKISNGNENFYSHLRKIFAEHKYYVVVAAIGVIVFKEAFDL